ncbi:MAG: hypothetical protein QXN28_10195 [Metallosphaera sp.]
MKEPSGDDIVGDLHPSIRDSCLVLRNSSGSTGSAIHRNSIPERFHNGLGQEAFSVSSLENFPKMISSLTPPLSFKVLKGGVNPIML